MMGDDRETKRKRGPRDIVDVSWATGMFLIFLSHSILFLLTNLLGTLMTATGQGGTQTPGWHE
jgi:hypothetical protein